MKITPTACRLSILLCLLMVASGAVAAPPLTKAYSQRVIVPADADHRLTAAVADFKSTLQQMTDSDFSVTQEYSGSGIFLIRADSPHAPDDAVAKLKNKGREPFIIRSDGTDELWIISNGDGGLSHGIYFYLEQLGVRFYLPNDNWTIIPQRRDITLKIDRLVAPAFKVRSFFGTGGFGPLTPIDPKLEMKGQLLGWQRRNRFGAEYILGGHTGQAFNKEYKEFLLKNPDYLAQGKWSINAKLNTANAAAVQLYVDWSLERMRKARAKDPNHFAISVDPADGGGHCQTEECLKIGSGSASDQVFYVANQVAKAVAKEFPGGHVSLYAYNAHADVPTIELEPNLYVMVAPYAFQGTGMTPEQLIQAWGRKVPRIGIREYWSITDWTKDLPKFDYRTTSAEKLRFWHENKVDGALVESTYSGGAMGLAWYVASRLMWDPYQKVDPLVNEFYDDAFGAARPPMQRMLERWADGFRLDTQELALSFRDMQEAMKLAGDNEAVLARLNDYGKYLQFLRLYHEYVIDDKDPEAAMEARLALLRNIWSTYSSAMVHTYRHYLFLVEFGRNKEAYKIFNIKDADAPGWKTVSTPAHQDVIRWMAEGAKQYQPLGFTARSFDGPLVRLDKSPPPGEAEWSPSMIFIGTTEFELKATPGVLRFPLRVKSAKGTTEVKILDENDKTVFTAEVMPDEAWREQLEEVTITLPQTGHYRLRLENRGNSINVQAPSNIPLVWRRFLTNQGAPSPRVYFYVPTELKKIAVSEPHGLGARFFNAEGERVTPESYDNDQLLVLPVPSGQDGKIWSVEYIRTPSKPLQMLNVPQVFSFFPQTLLVPQDALNP